MATKELILREKKGKLTWEVDPSLKNGKTLEHKEHPGLFFTIGMNEDGKRHIKSVDYPRDWGLDRTLDAVSSRSQKNECKHCDDDTESSLFPLVNRPTILGLIRERVFGTKKD